MPGGENGGRTPAPCAPVYPSAARLPLLGLGTWTQHVKGDVKDAVVTAIERVLGPKRGGGGGGRVCASR